MRSLHRWHLFKIRYRRTVEFSTVIALTIVIALLMAFKRFDSRTVVRELYVPPLQVTDVPVTVFTKKVAPPVKPVLPIVAPEAPLESDIRIPEGYDDVSLNIRDLPHPPEEKPVPIWIVEIEPKLIGGAGAIADYIKENNLYPKMARESGTSGSALIGFVVDQEGNPQDVYVIQEKPAGFGFGTAGITAIKAMKFTPGIQRDTYVSVEMQQLINFKTE